MKVLRAILLAVCLVAGLTASAERPQFAWCLEAGSDIDLSAHDMSAMTFSGSAGFRSGAFSIVGIGASVNMMISNSCRSFPIYAQARWNVPHTSGILFVDARGGLSLNYVYDNRHHAGGYASGSLGINLALGRSFQSYLTAGYTWIGRRDVADASGYTASYPDLHFAGIRLGISF